MWQAKMYLTMDTIFGGNIVLFEFFMNINNINITFINLLHTDVKTSRKYHSYSYLEQHMYTCKRMIILGFK